jgi:creatinine amidohydrolase/Fe(II)-dependent formamide hydrolase-like protein
MDKITFRELRRQLDQVVCEHDIFDGIDELLDLIEGTFYVFRTDTNQVMAKGIPDYESAKLRASQIRKSNNFKFDQISFKMERKPATQFGVSGDGKTFTNSRGERYPVQYSRNYSPSKRGRFQSYIDKDGNDHDIS